MILLFVAIIEVGAVSFLLWKLMASKADVAERAVNTLKDQIQERKRIKTDIETTFESMAKRDNLALSIKQYREVEEQLKAEQGRIAITQTELETVETRLRELEEIERELEASSVEIQEELSALKDKEKGLRTKNDQLKGEIQESMKHIEELLGEIELSAQVIEQVKLMKTQLLSTEDKIEKLLVQIEENNSQYVELKKRYDALDIEYAQLYEKFSNIEEPAKEGAAT